MVTLNFIITLIVFALITHIITSMYYKYRYELKEIVSILMEFNNIDINDLAHVHG